MDQMEFSDDSMDEVIARNINHLLEVTDPNSLSNLMLWEQAPEDPEFLAALIRNLDEADRFDADHEAIAAIAKAATRRLASIQESREIAPGASAGKRRRVELINDQNKNMRDQQMQGGSVRFNLNKPALEFIPQAISYKHLKHFNSVHYRADYQVKHNLANVDILHMSDFLDDLFYNLISPQLEGADPDAFVDISVSHAKLNHNIFIHSRVRNFCKEQFINSFYQTSQSAREFLLEGSFLLELLITGDRTGGGWGGASKTRAPTSINSDIKSRTCIIEIKNDNVDGSENSCGWWAIALGIANLTNAKISTGDKLLWKQIRQNKKVNGVGRLELAARNFCTKYNFNYSSQLGREHFETLYAALAPEYDLFVIEHDGKKFIKSDINKGINCLRQIYILLHEGHYHLVTDIAALFRANYFCPKHWVAWKEEGRHKCDLNCSSCKQPTNCQMANGATPIICATCNRQFKSQICFDRHNLNNICSKYLKCSKCEREHESRFPHLCGKIYCDKCHKNTDAPHYCYIQPKQLAKIIEEDAKFKIIVSFDIESMLIPNNTLNRAGAIEEVRDHQPNLLISHVSCSKCFNDESFSRPLNCNYCGHLERIFHGENCIKAFGNYIYFELAVKAEKAKGRVLVFAHNFKGYDGQFIYRDLFQRDFSNIEPTMVGNKILKLDVGNVRFIDSLSFFSQSLASLPKAFELTGELKKGTFPHLFNLPANQNYVGAWPAKEYYAYEFMTEDQKNKFDLWYSTVSHTEFNFQKEIEEYCKEDVKILAASIQKFRILFEGKTKINPLTRNFTLASIGLEVYRTIFLKDGKTLGITPITGYGKRKSSKIASAWLDYLEHCNNNTKIPREQIRGNYFADGAINNQVFEFNGCFWHGCPSCCPNQEEVHPKTGKTYAELYAAYQLKKDYYQRQGLELIEVWECAFKEACKNNTYLNNFIKKRLNELNRLDRVGGANLREALKGGRTNNLRFHYDVSNNSDERIKYFDVTSEYPFVLKNFNYPVGHPEVIERDFDLSIRSYNIAIINCKVLTPRQLFLPVLPSTVHGKLEFILCRTCAELKNQTSCTHSDEERCLTSTWTSAELKKAIELGYVIQEIYQVLNWQEYNNTLFKKYIDMWLEVKTLASGWSDAQKNNESLKQEFCNEFERREGIKLDISKMENNPGLRFIAKLMLNSFWGKLAQRANMPQTTVCKTHTEFYKLQKQAEEGIISLKGVNVVNDVTIIVNWEFTKDEDSRAGNTNVAIAAFVTSYARLHLYSFLELVVRTDPSQLLYFDTDSVIFVERRINGHWEEILKLGNCLGDLSDELKDYGADARIIKFVSGGPKNYALEIDLGNNQTKAIIKTKGIRANGLSIKLINIKNMVDMVKAYYKYCINSPIQIMQPRFIIERLTHKIRSSHMLKAYRVVSEKRRVIGNGTLPFGYVDGDSPMFFR